MKYTIIPSKRFLKDIKRCEKRGYDMRLLKDAVALLGETGQLPAMLSACSIGISCSMRAALRQPTLAKAT